MLFNGPFFIYSWPEGEYIHMRKNTNYHARDSVIPSAFRLYIREENDLSRLTGGAVDAAAVSFSELETLDETYGTVQFSNILWAILPNLENPALANLSIRQALAAGVDREDLSGYLAQNQQIASVPVPPAVTLGGASYPGAGRRFRRAGRIAVYGRRTVSNRPAGAGGGRVPFADPHLS